MTVDKMGNNRHKMFKYELKRCPFCGGHGILEYNHRAFIHGESTKVTFVRCGDCNARTARYELRDFGCSSHSSEACHMAIDQWNQRYEEK